MFRDAIAKVVALIAAVNALGTFLAESLEESKKQTALLRAIRFRSGTAASIHLVVLEQLGMSRFKFGINLSAPKGDDDAVKASLEAVLPDGTTVSAEADLVESTDPDGNVTKSAQVTGDNFIAKAGDIIQLKGQLFDAAGNPSPVVSDVGVVKDTIGPGAPVMSIVTLEQLPDAPTPSP